MRPRYEYHFGARGEQTKIIDPLLRETHLHHEFGNQTGRVLPLEFGPDGIPNTGDETGEPFAESFEYDEFGRQFLHVTFGGSAYPEQVSRPHRTPHITEYFENAANFAAGTPDEVREFRFDDHGRVDQITHTVDGNLVRTETKTFDDQGQLKVFRMTKVSFAISTISLAG